MPASVAHLVSPFPSRPRRRGLGDAAAIGTDAATGAAIGTAVPVVGTTIGGIVGGIIGAASSLFGSGAAKTTQAFAQALATKWYQLYLQRQPDAAGLQWWIQQIMQDGPDKAWSNFSSSSEPVAHNAIGEAAQYASQYGGPTVLGPTTTAFSPSVAPSYTGAAPAVPSYGATPAPLQASVLGTLTPSTLLLGAALLFGAVLLSRGGAKSASAP